MCNVALGNSPICMRSSHLIDASPPLGLVDAAHAQAELDILTVRNGNSAKLCQTSGVSRCQVTAFLDQHGC
ncbi:hypothetical protein RQ479_13125 [Mesorhizobium sp. ISC25]|uniref:hypothetical protein n=1 Tax=Mesorhizobium sp. ISC25 TaxID=3077335 RepID=UPI0035E07E3F